MKTIICPELLCVSSESSHQLIKLLISQLLNKMFFFSFFFNPVQKNEIETCSTQVIQNFYDACHWKQTKIHNIFTFANAVVLLCVAFLVLRKR